VPAAGDRPGVEMAFNHWTESNCIKIGGIDLNCIKYDFSSCTVLLLIYASK